MEGEKLEKLRNYFTALKLRNKDIAEMVGMSTAQTSQLLNGKDKFGKRTAMAFSEAFGFNPAWLQTGEGQMLNAASLAADDSIVWVEVVNYDARGGSAANDIIDEPQYAFGRMPFSASVARDGDIVMPVVGNSMHPAYPNGTYVLIRPLPSWREYLELGATYVLDLLDGRRVIKEIRAGHDHDHFTLYSVNPTYDPSEVSRDFILRIFAVLLSVRRDLIWT